jgi:hypothetical protein
MRSKVGLWVELQGIKKRWLLPRLQYLVVRIRNTVFRITDDGGSIKVAYLQFQIDTDGRKYEERVNKQQANLKDSQYS